ncbi:transglycosylase SLT domain-containing protein [Sphingomonas sp. MAH-20]|uniref:Transglycosylase SLT domain-containing protein n=2 Tax=Sphingomonas TaxID=13687 RepID=A0A6I4J2J0_9SPHN|nr:lytic transglycosylase domain-containing protein [Sphingomonas horti]MBA2919397.1 transglycosylase SLT domain-containing protein [Sphingomonas sp. CGMCC 1.13658]MVO78278.1 transglycosylase SLT domain-containing protein [Sphingomonas horti]
MVKRLLLPSVLLLGTATMVVADPTTPLAMQPASPQAPYDAGDPVVAAIPQWNALRQSDNLPFDSYASFLIAHPGWPGEAAMRRAAERALAPDSISPMRVIAFFDKFPPLTNTGQARYAEALASAGRPGDAIAAARKAWTSGSLTPTDEALILGRFGSQFTPADQDERMDRLLWAGKTSAAQRQIDLTSPAKRALFQARLALRTNAPGAQQLADALPAVDQNDAGFVADKAIWLRTASPDAARAWLARPRQLTGRPAEVERWFELLLSTARTAQSAGDARGAFQIAQLLDQSYAPGTVVRDQPLGERDDYTSIAWLAGWTALYGGRAADAVGMFERYASAARSPQTQAKGHFWAARAAQAAGRAGEANRFYEEAAEHPDQFYGQLALERLGRPIPAPGTLGATTPSPSERVAFNKREIVRAARVLGQQGDWQTQSQFIRAIAASVETDADHALANELAQGIGRPDLAVMVGRSARLNGASDYVRAGYPQVKLPEGQEAWSTIIHAIARQESQFDREAVSRAGARGLMQLMPGTAREAAAKIGLDYDASALTTDTGYNIQLGSSYFQRMLNYNGGNYPLAIAAYNAGQGNVNKWIAANGDPRLPGADIVKWIEQIPFSETRGYVQHVLENAVVYDTLHPEKATMRGPNLLSAYLGKGSRG